MHVLADSTLLTRVAAVIRRIIGAPDYEQYLVHAKACHPGQQPMSQDAYAKDCEARRYNQPGNRCC